MQNPDCCDIIPFYSTHSIQLFLMSNTKGTRSSFFPKLFKVSNSQILQLGRADNAIFLLFPFLNELASFCVEKFMMGSSVWTTILGQKMKNTIKSKHADGNLLVKREKSLFVLEFLSLQGKANFKIPF